MPNNPNNPAGNNPQAKPVQAPPPVKTISNPPKPASSHPPAAAKPGSPAKPAKEGKKSLLSLVKIVKPKVAGRASPSAPKGKLPPKQKVVTVKRKVNKIDLIKKQVGTFAFQLVTFTLFLSALGWWGYTQVMKQVLGRFDVLDWESAAATLYGAPQVLLIDPLRTEEFLRPDSAHHDTLWPYTDRFDDWPLLDTLWYAPGIPRHSREGFEAWEIIGTNAHKQAGMADPWKELLFRNKIAFSLAQEPALTAIPEGTTLLILPGTLLMSAEEKKGVKDFVAEGGKLLFCWSPGCRDELGGWSGYTFLEQIVGGTLAGLVTDPTGGETILLNGSGPITSMVAPGSHLEFFTYNGNIRLKILEPRTIADAWEFTPYWQNGGAEASGSHPAMAAHGSYVAGKFVWFSFTPDAIQPHKNNPDIMTQLALNAINWLSGRPLVDISIWPPGYSAGGSLVAVGKGSVGAISQTQASIGPDRTPLDLILDPDDIPDDIEFFGSRWGDVIMASQDTALFNSLNPRDIFDWMEKNTIRLEHITGRRPKGLFPPDWDYSEFSAIGSATEGLRFVMGSPNPRFYGPTESLLRPHGWWIFSEKVQLATLPKCQVSSYEWVEYGHQKGSDGLLRAMTNDMRRIQKMGGMYIGILDPATLADQRAFDLTEKLAAKMDSMGIWRASLGEVMDRFHGWRGLRVSVFEVNSTRLQLQLSNESDVDLEGVRLEVYFTPDVIYSVKVESQVMGLRPGNIEWNRRTGLCSFSLPEVSAGLNATLTIDVTAGEVKKEVSKK